MRFVYWTLVLTFVSALVGLPAVADTIIFTDVPGGIPGVVVTMTGDFTGCSGSNTTCSGNLHINTSGATMPSTGTWEIGWFELKLDTNTYVTLVPAAGDWNSAPGNGGATASVWWSGGGPSHTNILPEDHYSAMYNQYFLKDSQLTAADVAHGLLVGTAASHAYTYDFAFTFNFNGSQFNNDPSLKIGYYSIDSVNGTPTNPAIRQMSQHGIAGVPEPSALVLLGSGLFGLGTLARKLHLGRS